MKQIILVILACVLAGCSKEVANEPTSDGAMEYFREFSNQGDYYDWDHRKAILEKDIPIAYVERYVFQMEKKGDAPNFILSIFLRMDTEKVNKHKINLFMDSEKLAPSKVHVSSDPFGEVGHRFDFLISNETMKSVGRVYLNFDQKKSLLFSDGVAVAMSQQYEEWSEDRGGIVIVYQRF